MTFPADYAQLLTALLSQGVVETNARTGVRVRVLPGGRSFQLDLALDRALPVCGVRRLHPATAAAEVAWFLSGSRDVTWLRRYAPIWDKFVEADGTTVDSAYGYRWRTHFGRDQLYDAVRALRLDPSDRRVFVSAWDPAHDGLGVPAKNVPCPVGFTLGLLDRRLHSSLLIRSSDVFVGLPYDVMGHVLLMDAIAVELGVSLGTAHFTLAHAHLYECHWGMAEDALAGMHRPAGPALPGRSVTEVEGDPEGYVEHVRDLGRLVEWPAFNPRPEVVL